MRALLLPPMFLRHLALSNQPPEASFFSAQLVQKGFLSTSPIRLSLLEARQFAWRTRIVSSRGEVSCFYFSTLQNHLLCIQLLVMI